MLQEKEFDFPIVPSPALERAAQDCCPLLADDEAREEWIACCSRRFFPLAKRIADDDDLAREALQVSWIKIFQAANVSVRGPTACPWVASVVANSAKDLRRQQRRRREVSLEAVGTRSAGQDLEAMVQERQLLTFLHEMIAMLPDTYRRVVELRLQEGVSTKQTARRLGISRSNVTTRLNRAVRMLKRSIKSRMEPRNPHR
ncbi:MAG: sigma-70 family RNA polymerase sigma factor [Bryobacterales bacterium]|nr:sigma-70 family RNA polymerase sigma factor [Bryobacterales bacterium]MDE0621905.1 sigma-70 family RNA polymerase sigma factor [Bryobacterales bacterium]